ncbi:MAG: ComEA family DNA-binding protein [Coriobacteriia bacterium]
MSLQVPPRVRELLARAGLGGLSDQAALAVCVVCAGAVVLAAWRFWPHSRGGELPPLPEAPASGEASGETSGAVDGSGMPADPGGALVVVHVVGAVLRPGVYSLPVGSRVADAVAAAGGNTGNAAPNAVNLARVLADGEQVYLPTADEASATAAAAGTAGTAVGGVVPAGGGGVAASGRVDLNRATVADLDTLPGIGPATAQKIVDDRAANGPFKTIEDLMRVSGIGEKKFDALKDLITVG